MRKVWIALILTLFMTILVWAQQKQALSVAATTCTVTGASCLINSVDPTQGGATFTISANASANTLQFEASGDGGTSWVALNVTPSNSSTQVSSTTSTGTWQANVAAYTNVRIRMSTLAGGTATVSIIFSTASARGGSGGGGGGAGTITACTQAGGVAYNNGTTNTLTCDAFFQYSGTGVVQILPNGTGTGIGLTDTATTSGASLAVPMAATQAIGGASTFGNTAGISSTTSLAGAVTVGTVSAFQSFGNPATGNATAMHGFHATQLTNRAGGSLTNAVGFYAELQTTGQTGNFGFFDAGATNRDVFGILSAVSVATGTTPCTNFVAGTAGAHCMNEGTTPTGTLTGYDTWWANATAHCMDENANNVELGCALVQPAGLVGVQTITGADYTNTSVTPSTVFSWTLPATVVAKNYKYTCDLMWESTAATLVGPVFGLNISAAPTQLTGNAYVQNALTGTDVNGYLSNTTTGSQTLVTGSAAGVTSTNYLAKIWGTIEAAPTAGATFIINAASTSGTTANLNIRRGGACKMELVQ